VAHEHPERVRNHWYWRPGWRIGRRFYTWHLTFADQPDVVAFADSYRGLLDSMPETDAIPAQWLHLTMQGIGFTDEVEHDDIEKIINAARQRCAALEPLTLIIGAPYVDSEAVQIAVQPPEPAAELRLALRAAIADVWGAAKVPEAEESFLPHMSLAYINRAGAAAPLAAEIGRITTPPVRATIDQCQLIVIHRDERMYTWDTYASIHLGIRAKSRMTR
jgi:2'-5' RNA ligase